MFKYGVIPDDFNITHIVPIIKDNNKPANTISNLRPISISNSLAQIFERIILNKIPELKQTHQNQFGYKAKTSCTHALFAMKETAINYIRQKSQLFVASLDAIKAFDLLSRSALFYKMLKKKFIISVIILLKLYYDKLCSKVKINNLFSEIFKLLRGVKQGGILGDDLNLLSPCSKELQTLPYICNDYGYDWALEFNPEKCKFTVFGTQRFNETRLYINNSLLKYTNSLEYLGLNFTYDLNMSSFFLNKGEKLRKAYFGLNCFGFKPDNCNILSIPVSLVDSFNIGVFNSLGVESIVVVVILSLIDSFTIDFFEIYSIK
jgi:hypothetical protein